MPEKIVQLNEEVIKGQLKELVRGSVEETLNELLEAWLVNHNSYEQGTNADYNRDYAIDETHFIPLFAIHAGRCDGQAGRIQK